jgi:hypothetical protein
VKRDNLFQEVLSHAAANGKRLRALDASRVAKKQDFDRPNSA